MSHPLHHKRILLGVTGSIACYKAITLASRLTQAGALVDVVLTSAAQKFITPLAFQSVTGRRCYTDADLWGAEAHVLHVGLGREADLMMVAPTTANTLAKLAHGQSDDLLGLALLSAGIHVKNIPYLVAPAMDGDMWSHPATQENIRLLKSYGATIIEPEEGRLASGLVAKGRMPEPEQLFGQIRFALSRNAPLKGRKLLVSAGATIEPIDPVRYITNRSSGRQGVALAQAGLDAGADVTLISPKLHIPIPFGVKSILVETAREMLDGVMGALPETELLIMASAVADFRPAIVAKQKIKKGDGMPAIPLERNPDILQTVYKQCQKSGQSLLLVGFSAETENLLENAQSKLIRKGMGMIVANDVSAPDAGFAVPTNRVTLLYADGKQEALPLMSKEAVAGEILSRVIQLLDVGS